ncbi:MAG: hypothetical protein JST09_11455 [Bacteroidetes bacterium]|nr:hypothetical protein [Bacteroidota bacterium]MBS1611172.1 hypothetical protein [Bacteroidota bacterium]
MKHPLMIKKNIYFLLIIVLALLLIVLVIIITNQRIKKLEEQPVITAKGNTIKQTHLSTLS